MAAKIHTKSIRLKDDIKPETIISMVELKSEASICFKSSVIVNYTIRRGFDTGRDAPYTLLTIQVIFGFVKVKKYGINRENEIKELIHMINTKRKNQNMVRIFGDKVKRETLKGRDIFKIRRVYNNQGV